MRGRIVQLRAAALRLSAAGRTRLRPPSRPGPAPAIRVARRGDTPVDEYWGGHTVMADLYRTTAASEEQLAWRFDQYPLFREFSGLWGDHDGEVVLDYGCGPGNDVTGFALYTGAERVVGMDVSRRALDLAARRLALHRVDPSRIDLCQLGDAHPVVPLEDASVDFFQSMGVLHHVSDPLPILRELHRVLRPEAGPR